MSKRNVDSPIAVGLCIAVAIGAGLGVAMNSLALGIGVSLAIGATIHLTQKGNSLSAEDYQNLVVLKPKSVNPIIRLFALIVTLLCIPTFSFAIVDLLTSPYAFEQSVKNALIAGTIALFFWPFSYVAIKGKLPSKWHPYQ